MKDWKSTVRNWWRRDNEETPQPKKKVIIGYLYECNACDYQKTFEKEGDHKCPQYPHKCEGWATGVEFKREGITSQGSKQPKMQLIKAVYKE